MIVTPGGVDSHVHWLSPQVAEAALAGGVTTMVAQDYGPIWNLGANPADGLRDGVGGAGGRRRSTSALLVRGSSSRPEGVEESLRAGGAGLKIHEDVAAGPRADALRARRRRPPRRPARDPHRRAERGAARRPTPPACSPAARCTCSTSRASAAATRPTCCALAGRERILTSSTNPTVPVRRRRRGRAPGDGGRRAPAGAGHAAGRRRHPARRGCGPWTMAAESVLHDLGVIPMLSSRLAGDGPGRRDRAARVPVRRRDEGAARRRAGAGRQRARPALPGEGHDQPGDRARPRRPTSARCGRAGWPTWCCGGPRSSPSGPSWCSRPACRPGARRARAARPR